MQMLLVRIFPCGMVIDIYDLSGPDISDSGGPEVLSCLKRNGEFLVASKGAS